MSDGPRCLFLGHAAERTGPPIILLDILRWLRSHTDIVVGTVLQEPGPLLAAYRDLGPTWIVPDWLGPGAADLTSRALWKLGLGPIGRRIHDEALRRPARHIGDWPLVYVNTAGCARLLPLLPHPPTRLIAHIHELSTGLDLHMDPATRSALLDRADRVICVADAVAEAVIERSPSVAARTTVIRGCIEAPEPPGPEAPTRAALGIPDDAFVIGSSGLQHWRKAPDLFVSLAARMLTGADDDPWFVWVGGSPDDPAGRAAQADVARLGVAGRVRFVPHQEYARDWFRLFDAFALTAREDAFPLVGLEAASVGLPIACFASGGLPEFVRDDAGAVVAYPDLDALADTLRTWQRDPGLRRRLGQTGAARVRSDHLVPGAAARIAHEIEAVWSR